MASRKPWTLAQKTMVCRFKSLIIMEIKDGTSLFVYDSIKFYFHYCKALLQRCKTTYHLDPPNLKLLNLNSEMNNYISPHRAIFPSALIEEVNRAHKEDAANHVVDQSSVFVLAHERSTDSDESEFIIEGVFRTLESANERTMELFRDQYNDFHPADFYAQGTWEGIGENSVGWYVSRNGTLALEIHDHAGHTCRIYAELHDIE